MLTPYLKPALDSSGLDQRNLFAFEMVRGTVSDVHIHNGSCLQRLGIARCVVDQFALGCARRGHLGVATTWSLNHDSFDHANAGFVLEEP